METIKQRFKRKKFVLSLNIFTLIILLLIAAVAGFLLSDSGAVKYSVFGNKMNCGELLNATKDFMNQVNYWRNEDAACEKKLWTCGLQLKQLIARAPTCVETTSSNTTTQ